MPRLKPSDQEERNRIVRACIAGNQERQGIDDIGLAKYLGVVPNTVRNKREAAGDIHASGATAGEPEIRRDPGH